MANQQTNQPANQQLKDQLDSYKSRISKSRKRKRIAYIAGLCLVAVAIVGLVLPAATLEFGKTYCGQEEHTHTDACVNRTVVCALPDTSNGNGHVHTPSCYDEQSTLAICGKTPVAHMHLPTCVNAAGTELVCGQEETVHMHTLGCVDPATNTLVCDTEGLAHVHGVTCYSLGADGAYVLVCKEPSVGHVHTMLCLDPETGEVVCGQEEAIELSHIHTDACYDEELICGMEEHVHNELCYDEITEAIIKKDEESSAAKEAAEEAEGVDGVAEGDLTAEEIAEAKDQGLLFENEEIVVAFDVPEKYKDDIVLTVTETDEEVEFVEAIEATEEVNAEGEPVDDEAAQDGDNGEPVFFSEDGSEADGTDKADEANKPTNAVNAARKTLVTQPVEEEPTYKINLRIEATLAGEPVDDIEALGITAKLQVKPKVIAPIINELNSIEIAPEIKGEVGAELMVLQQPDNSAAQSISEIRSEQIDEVVVTSVQEAATTFNIVSDVFTTSVKEPKDIPFTVSYMAKVPMPDLEVSDGTLKVIDTTGGNLPKNNVTPSTKTMAVDDSGNIVMNEEIVDIYTPNDYTYFKYPTFSHINKVAALMDKQDEEKGEVKAYELSEIMVLNAGEWDPNKDITYNKDKAVEYKEGKTFLTNNPEPVGEEGETYVIVTEGSMVVLIYKTTTGERTVDGSFYDYDITDGYIYNTDAGANNQNPNNQRVTSLQGLDNWAYTRSANTLKKGINSDSNYAGTGMKLGFGNINTGTGRAVESWSKDGVNNLPNMYNYGTFEGCTFGLVSGINGNKIQYSSGVVAPNLFNEGSAAGKKDYNDSTLTFSRIGDTYTLSSTKVENNILSGLGKLSHPGVYDGVTINPSNGKPYGTIWTNNFWPVDNTSSYGTDNHDLKFGSSSLTSKRRHVGTNQTITRRDSGNSLTKYSPSTFPPSDDGLDHNSYFGMHYTIDFKLTEDYIGPLNYIFFGDDDLWVFLDGKLVVDIGGVHSSVGEYVNLWDYIKKGDSSQHTLSVFYTERGASGSTCYMNFTLPSVSNISEQQNTGSFSVTKAVSAAKNSEAYTKPFKFKLELFEESGKVCENVYPYTICDKNGKVLSEQDAKIGNNGTFKLRDGDFITVSYLPLNWKYRVQEVFDDTADTPPYNIEWKYYESGSIKGSAAGVGLGNTPNADQHIVIKANTMLMYVNTVPPQLPATGGVGTYWYWIGGGLLVALALLMLWRRQTMATAPASPFTKSEASILAFFGDTNFTSPSGKPESVYSKGWSRARNGDESTRKGGRY